MTRFNHFQMIAKQAISKQGPNLLALVLILMHTSFLVTGYLLEIRQHQLALTVAQPQLDTVDITKGPKLLLPV